RPASRIPRPDSRLPTPDSRLPKYAIIPHRPFSLDRRREGFAMSALPHTDVLVIGSGMAGAAISKRLSDRGVRVVCLEQGPWVLPAEHPHYSNEWEFELMRDWNRSPNVRRAATDYPTTSVGDIANPMLMNVVGGSTTHYNAHWPRLKPVDFR